MEASNKDKRKFEFVLCIGLLIVASVLGMDTNHNPMPWINRILSPIEKEGWTIYWGGILLLILIYNVFRKLYALKGWYIFNKNGKCFMWTLIFILSVNAINPSVIQTVKMVKSGLDTIYLDREALMGFNIYDTSEGGTTSYKTEGYIMLINCSNQTIGPFKIKVILTERGDGPTGEFESAEEYYLAPKEQRNIELNLEGMLDEPSKLVEDRLYTIGKKFEVILWNNEEQVKFLSE